MAEMQHVVKVEEGRPAADGRPSVGPTYRSAFARSEERRVGKECRL